MLIVSVIVTGASANYCPGVLGQFNNINVQPSSVSDWTFYWCTAGNLMHSDQRDAPLFTIFGSAAERRVGKFTAQDIANVAWACSTVDHTDAQLFAILG